MKGMQRCQIPLVIDSVRPRFAPLYLLDLVPLLASLFLISYLIIIGRFLPLVFICPLNLLFYDCLWQSHTLYFMHAPKLVDKVTNVGQRMSLFLIDRRFRWIAVLECRFDSCRMSSISYQSNSSPASRILLLLKQSTPLLPAPFSPS